MNGKNCSMCDEYKPFEEYYNNKNTKDGVSSACIVCMKRRRKERRIERKKEAKEFHKQLQYESQLRCFKKRYNTDENYKLKILLRNRINFVLNGRKSETIENLLCCTIEELWQHLEDQFQEGMTRENYGKDGWEVDHEIPCSKFDLTDPKQQAVCFHWRNLQPLWFEDNVKKSDNIQGFEDLTIDMDYLNIYKNRFLK